MRASPRGRRSLGSARSASASSCHGSPPRSLPRPGRAPASLHIRSRRRAAWAARPRGTRRGTRTRSPRRHVGRIARCRRVARPSCPRWSNTGAAPTTWESVSDPSTPSTRARVAHRTCASSRAPVPTSSQIHFLRAFLCSSFPRASRISFRCSSNRAKRSSHRTRYRVSQPNAALSGAASIWHRLTRPSGSTWSKPAASRTRRCFEIAGRLTSCGSASSPTVASPAASCSRMARRIGWANAAKIASRSSLTADWLTIWLRDMREGYLTIWLNGLACPADLSFQNGRRIFGHDRVDVEPGTSLEARDLGEAGRDLEMPVERALGLSDRGGVNVVVERRIVEHPIHSTEDVFQNRREGPAVRIRERLERTRVDFREQPRLEREARRERLQGNERSVLGDDAPSRAQLAPEDFAEQALSLALLGARACLPT